MTRERSALLDRVDAELGVDPGAFGRLQERREQKLLRRRVGGAALGLVLTAVIVSAFALTPFRDDERLVRSQSPVPLVAPPGSYYYVRAGSWYQGSGSEPSAGEVWVGPDGSGRLLQGKDEERFPPGEFPAAFLPELSTDPGVLLEQLTQRGSEGGVSPNLIASTSPGRSQETTSLLRTMQDLLGMSADVFLAPEQIAATFEAAGMIKEVKTETGVEDPFGRDSIRQSWVVDYNIGPGSRVLWYFEPSTGQFMGEYWVDQRTGEIEGASWVEHAGISTSVESVPAPEASTFPKGSASRISVR